MKYKTVTLLVTLGLSLNAHAGWMEDLSSSGAEFQKKLQQIDSGDVKSVSSSLSDGDVIKGLKQALKKGAGYAVNKLGKTDGFLGNARVKIPMPENLQRVESLLRQSGNDKSADEFVTTMNRAAESAVPLTLEILKNGVTTMSFDDAQRILQGPDDAATQYLKKTGGESLNAKILPIVKDATSRNGVTSTYKKMVDKLGVAGAYLNLDDYDIDRYVTDKAVAGLFVMIAEEEKKIRDNPAARTTEILKKVFGAN